METKLKEIAEKINNKYIKTFKNDSIFDYEVDCDSNSIIFNYPNYFDGEADYQRDIQKQSVYLLKQGKKLKQAGFFFWVADYVINL